MPEKKLATTIALVFVLQLPGEVTAESLENVVFRTLASNPEVRAEINRKFAREQALRQARAGYYPSVDLFAAVGNENSKNRYTRAIGETDYVDLTRNEEAFTVTQNLFQGFGTSSEVDTNSARVQAANHRLHELTEQTALRVAEVYLGVLRQQELVRISENNLQIHTDVFEKVRSRSQSGVGRRADIDQAAGRVALARANLIADRANLQSAHSRYQRVVGELPRDLVKPPDKNSKLPGNLEQAVKLAIDENPLVKAAQAELDAALAQREGAKSPYYPSLDLVFEQSRGENLDGLEGVEKDYSLMLRMRYNLFNGGYDVARVTEAGFRINESKDNLENTRREVIELMNLAWNSFQSVDEQIPYLEQHVSSARNTRSAYTDQFKIGQRTLLDLLDSENELYQATRSRISAEYERQLNGYRILANLGKFVDVLEINKSRN